jgi:hypothetical protein
MKKIKNQITIMRKQLRLSYDEDKITQLENDHKLKMRKYNKLLKDNEKLKNTRTQHLKEIKEMNLDGDWDQKKQVLVDELRD